MPPTDPTAELAELDAAIEAARLNVRRLEQDHREAVAESARARRAIEDAYATGVPADKLEREAAQADAKAAGPWAESIRRAQQIVRERESERATFVADRLTALLDVFRPEDEAVAAELTAALQAVPAALRKWRASADRLQSLLSALPLYGRPRVTDLDIAPVVDAIERALQAGDIPAPELRVPPFLDPSAELPAGVRQLERQQQAERDAADDAARGGWVPWRQGQRGADAADDAEVAA